MKSSSGAMAALQKAIADKDSAAITAMSSKLTATFDEVAMYWEKKNVADAVSFAKTARAAADAVGAAASPAEQNANMMKLQAQCVACHRAHRGGTAPNYTIK
jgi:mono/diheme cytochrome c family protein